MEVRGFRGTPDGKGSQTQVPDYLQPPTWIRRGKLRPIRGKIGSPPALEAGSQTYLPLGARKPV